MKVYSKLKVYFSSCFYKVDETLLHFLSFKVKAILEDLMMKEKLMITGKENIIVIIILCSVNAQSTPLYESGHRSLWLLQITEGA